MALYNGFFCVRDHGHRAGGCTYANPIQARTDPTRYDTGIAQTRATPSGHLSIDHGSFVLHYEKRKA